MGTKKISHTDFNSRQEGLRKALAGKLEAELDECTLPDAGDDDSDLYDLPTVDSKTVAKMSPVVKEWMDGIGINPKWIRKGGYTTIDEAVDHILEQFAKDCVEPASEELATSST